MRLWTLHPRHLDSAGQTAVWREALLAQAVLRGRTRGYRHHPQLARFRAAPSPRAAINAYLAGVHAEASARGYRFDRGKLGRTRAAEPLVATRGQLDYEWLWLLDKLRRRSPDAWRRARACPAPDAHPLFTIVDGPVSDWERNGGSRGE
jgi:hypothetical protein